MATSEGRRHARAAAWRLAVVAASSRPRPTRRTTRPRRVFRWFVSWLPVPAGARTAHRLTGGSHDDTEGKTEEAAPGGSEEDAQAKGGNRHPSRPGTAAGNRGSAGSCVGYRRLLHRG